MTRSTPPAREIFVAGAAAAGGDQTHRPSRDSRDGPGEQVGRIEREPSLGELEVDAAALTRLAGRLERAAGRVASATAEAPAEVDAGDQTELVVRLLERLVTASTEVANGLDAGGRAVVAVGRAVTDADEGVRRQRAFTQEGRR